LERELNDSADSMSSGEIRVDEGELFRLDRLMIDARTYHKKQEILEKLKKQGEEEEKVLEFITESLDLEAENKLKDEAVARFFNQVGFKCLNETKAEEIVKKMGTTLTEEEKL